MQSRLRRRTEAQETLERSILMAPVQRKGLAAILAALVLSTGAIGPLGLASLAGSFVGFLVIKMTPVQRRLGVWSLGAVWVVGQAGIVGAILLSTAPPQTLLGLIAVPTILGSVVWPVRWVPVAALATGLLILVTGLVADAALVAGSPPIVAIPAAIAVAASLMTLVARSAEAGSRVDTMIDPLTGVANRFALNQERARLSAPASAGHPDLTVIVADIDRFKSINDTYGHAVGDRALAAVALAMRDTVGSHGTVFRVGGEEFVVLLEDSAAGRGVAMAEQIRAAATRAALDHPVTLSLGVASSCDDGVSGFEELFALADARLLHAKRTGRDRVTASGGGRRSPAPAAAADSPASAAKPGVRADATGVVRSALDRQRLIEVCRRQYRANPLAYAIVLGTLAASSGVIGWAPLIPVVLGAIPYRLGLRAVARMRRPEATLGTLWMLAQLANAFALVLAGAPGLWVLAVLSLMLVASSAAFPRRYVVAGAGFTAALVVGAALVIDHTVFATAPQTVAVGLAMVITTTITGSAVGRLAAGMWSVAAHDALTGLPNGAACAGTAADLLGRSSPLALIVGDLDHFKQINDSFGHQQGDVVLVALVSRLSAEMRADAMLFRLGGEEFGILVAGDAADDAALLAERLRAAVAARPLAGSPVTISFGVAIVRPDDRADYARVYRRADAALYRAKHEGRDRVVLDGDPGVAGRRPAPGRSPAPV